jgi:lipoprotein-anchoring transpeptidase ErfK/SrfK
MPSYAYRRFAVLTVPFALAACGFNGTDPDTAESPRPAAAAPVEPDFAAFEQADTPDAQARPQMQLQVVLDSLGFGPGVIDGGMGMSTRNALKGFQEANGLAATGDLDDATRQALGRWQDTPATRVVRIPASWGSLTFAAIPEEPAEQAKLKHLGYEDLDEKLAERFHTTADVLHELNPGGQPAGTPSATPATGTAAPTPQSSPSETPRPAFRPGQLVRVPNVRLGADVGTPGGDDPDWSRTLASLGVGAAQPKATKVVVDKSDGTLKAFDQAGKLVAMFTVTSGSGHDPLPLGEWKIVGVSKNPPFHYNPDLFWDADANDEKATLPPGPNGPVGVVWIDLSKEHYGIHGTPEPQTIGRTQSHGCVRLTNWDAARLAQMVDGSTQVVFQA